MKHLFLIILLSSAFSLTAQTVPDTLWSYNFARYTMGSPTIDGNVYYTGNEKGTLLALDIESGKEIWKTQFPGGMYHNVLIIGENLFVDFSIGIACVDKKTGKQKWIVSDLYQFDDDVSCKLVQNEDGIVFNTIGSAIVCIAQKDGKERWRFAVDGNISPVNVYKDSYVFACEDGYLYRISKKTGIQETKIKISEPNEDQVRFFSLPPIISDDICITHLYGEVIAISLETNQQNWKHTQESPFLFQFDRNAVCMTDEGMVAINIKSGKKDWEIPGRHAWYMYPVFSGGNMYYLSRKEGGLYVVNPAGKIQSGHIIKGKTYTSPQVASGKIILAVGDRIFAIADK